MLGVVVTAVLAVVQLDGIGMVVALLFLPIFAVTTSRGVPGTPPPGVRLASETASWRRSLRFNGAAGVLYAVILALMLLLDTGAWILPAILLGNAVAQELLARRVAAAEALDPQTLQVTRAGPRPRGGGGLLLWRREWGDVVPAGRPSPGSSPLAGSGFWPSKDAADYR